MFSLTVVGYPPWCCLEMWWWPTGSSCRWLGVIHLCSSVHSGLWSEFSHILSSAWLICFTTTSTLYTVLSSLCQRSFYNSIGVRATSTNPWWRRILNCMQLFLLKMKCKRKERSCSFELLMYHSIFELTGAWNVLKILQKYDKKSWCVDFFKGCILEGWVLV